MAMGSHCDAVYGTAVIGANRPATRSGQIRPTPPACAPSSSGGVTMGVVTLDGLDAEMVASDCPGPYLSARRHYEDLGFAGWVRFADLPAADLPASPGVYVVLRPSIAPVSFLAASPAGSHKGKSPTVEVSRLQAEWVSGTAVVYIGKATSLRDRLHAYRRQGVGSKAGHWGGRFLWQCSDASQAHVGWMVTDEDPADVEFDLIAQFKSVNGDRLPFANLNQGRRRAPE